MTNDEKAASYDNLVERLHDVADYWHKDAKSWSYASAIRAHLPPRPQKREEVPWWQAIEGLKSGKYRRAWSNSAFDIEWDYGLKSHGALVALYDEDLGTWLAELA